MPLTFDWNDMDLSTLWAVILLVFGFGFVVFVHELGHFLAAKWAGVKVEQFAVGFGQAIFAWRQGIGLRLGSTRKDYERRINEHLASQGVDIEHASARQIAEAEEALGVSETEYRINWIPLGGYVKMLGQDDLKPGAEADDPRAYNRKSVGKRMVIVSAGVIMNIILAAIGFMVLFLMGFNAPAPVVGGMLPGSPAQFAVNEQGEIDPIRVGDKVLSLDGTITHDYTKIALNTALLESNVPAPIVVQRRTGEVQTLYITPQRRSDNSKEFLMLGITGSSELRGLEKWPKGFDEAKAQQMLHGQALLIRPGDVITHINGKPVDARTDYPVLDEALQESFGRPVMLTVKAEDGSTREVAVQPMFQIPFADDVTLNLLGMVPRTVVAGIGQEDSPVLGKVFSGDIVLSITSATDPLAHPSAGQLRERLSNAGKVGSEVTLTLQRPGQPEPVEVKVVPSLRLGDGEYGLGIALTYDGAHAVASDVLSGSPAEKAGIPAGARITGINGKAVESWYDVHRELRDVKADSTVEIAYITPTGDAAKATVTVTPEHATAIQGLRYSHALQLQELRELRQTSNPLTAAGWGVTETRDFTLQFYLTLKRMVTGDVSYKNMMGPVGIFHAGTKISERGYDWLLWFLSMISANLAVVNFLPIPIVDGGLFTFLILEKIQGKPLSPRAQSIAQVVGLALLLGIFLLVTYQDITRLFQI